MCLRLRKNCVIYIEFKDSQPFFLFFFFFTNTLFFLFPRSLTLSCTLSHTHVISWIYTERRALAQPYRRIYIQHKMVLGVCLCILKLASPNGRLVCQLQMRNLASALQPLAWCFTVHYTAVMHDRTPERCTSSSKREGLGREPSIQYTYTIHIFAPFYGGAIKG